MQVSFICETPFQLLNCINYTVGNIDSENDRVDLYVGEMFQNFDIIVRRIKSKNIFQNVYTYSYKQATSKGRISSYDNVLRPKRFLEEILTEKKIISTYNYIFVSVITRAAMAMVLVNKSATVSFYDDGIGSYRGDISGYNVSNKLRSLLYIRGVGKRFFQPEALYVNNPSMCRSTIKAEIRALPEIKKKEPQFITLLHDIFGETNPIYSKNRLIFLSQPSDIRNDRELNVYVNVSKKVNEIISKYHFIYRPHPRDKKIIGNPEIVDDRGGLWELVCEEYIDENSILVGYFSTAQCIPKILFNLEPFIIFTFSLYQECFSLELINQFKNEVSVLKSYYSKPEKICMVTSCDELDQILKQLLQG